MDLNIKARDILERSLSVSHNEYWKLRTSFEKYAKVQGLDISRSYHPNYYDSDETEEHWITWLSMYAYVHPLIKQLTANQKVVE